jgi:hypothetical protein
LIYSTSLPREASSAVIYISVESNGEKHVDILDLWGTLDSPISFKKNHQFVHNPEHEHLNSLAFLSFAGFGL